MTSTEVERFVHRDWRLVEASTAEFWAEEKQRLSVSQLFALVDGFRAGLRAARPDWPTTRERDEDLANHVRLSRELRRVVIRPDR